MFSCTKKKNIGTCKGVDCIYRQYLKFVDGFNSCLPARSQSTLIGLSPLTSHCRMAVSPFFTVTIRDGAEKYGDADSCEYVYCRCHIAQVEWNWPRKGEQLKRDMLREREWEKKQESDLSENTKHRNSMRQVMPLEWNGYRRLQDIEEMKITMNVKWMKSHFIENVKQY